MKKRKIILLIGLCLTLTIISTIYFVIDKGEKENKEVKRDKETVSNSIFDSNEECININVKSDNTLCFDIVLFSNEKIKEVEFLSVIGENIGEDTFEVEIINNTIEKLQEYSYNGIYCSDWMITLTQKGEVKECTLDRLCLAVDGETRELKFEKSIKYSSEAAHIWNEEFMFKIFPTEFSSDYFNNDLTAVYSFKADKNVVLKNIKMLEDIKVNANVVINGNEMDIKTLPVTLDAGDEIDVCVQFESESFDEFDYVHTNIIFEYECEGENKSNVGVVTFNPVYPITHGDFSKIDNYIEYIVQTRTE